jgi:hypothetical protein
MRSPLAVVCTAALLLAGCGDFDTSKRRSAAPEAVGVTPDPFSMGAPVKKPARKEATPNAPAPSGTASSRTAVAPNQPRAQEGPVGLASGPPPEGRVREKAASGAGKKGHYSKGIITTPLAAYWRAQERITYEAQVTYPLKLYKAQYGHFPKTLKEFEDAILKPNRVKLPELPQGHRYVYDPEKGELLVEHPG